jgi:Glycosyltransferase Family 4
LADERDMARTLNEDRAQLRGQVAALEAQWAVVSQGVGWRLLSGYRSAIQVVLPQGTLRRRVYTRAMSVVQRAVLMGRSPVAQRDLASPPGGARGAPAEGTVLFISHDSERTGAPIVLLSLLKWIRAKTTLPFEVLLKDGGGDLRGEFEALAPVKVWGEHPEETLAPTHIGLVYSNTLTNGEILDALARPGRPVISHVHELQYWTRYRVDPGSLARMLTLTRHYIAASKAVKHHLVDTLRVPEDRVEVIYEFISTGETRVGQRSADNVREELRLPPDAYVVGACGTTDWGRAPICLSS